MVSSWRQGSGKLPEFGAIFMCNTETRAECFHRSIFALPFSSAEFVREVREGMVLFLFDHQQKKLYGVFEAVSNGGLNIVPHAYTSSQKSFPAQVRFRIIWKCSPLRQREFQDAIRDNYYTEYKFNFGLSKDQVWRLLHLFESRVRIQKSPTERKIKHSDHSNEKIKHYDHTNEKIKHSDHSNEKKSVDMSSSESLELGDFIPLFSPESSPSSGSQSSPCCSEDQDFPEHHPEVKGLYSDHIGERKSAFGRLEESATCTTDETKDLDIEKSRRYADVVTTKEIMKNLSQIQKSWRRKIQTGTNHVPRKRETTKVGSVFSRLNFNSGSKKQESDTFDEKEKKRGSGGCDKYYNGRAVKNRLTFPVEKFDNGGEAVDNTKLLWRDLEGRLWIIPRC